MLIALVAPHHDARRTLVSLGALPAQVRYYYLRPPRCLEVEQGSNDRVSCPAGIWTFQTFSLVLLQVHGIRGIGVAQGDVGSGHQYD